MSDLRFIKVEYTKNQHQEAFKTYNYAYEIKV